MAKSPANKLYVLTALFIEWVRLTRLPENGASPEPPAEIGLVGSVHSAAVPSCPLAVLKISCLVAHPSCS